MASISLLRFFVSSVIVDELLALLFIEFFSLSSSIIISKSSSFSFISITFDKLLLALISFLALFDIFLLFFFFFLLSLLLFLLGPKIGLINWVVVFIILLFLGSEFILILFTVTILFKVFKLFKVFNSVNSGKLFEVLISSFSLINEFSFKELTLFIGKVFLLFEALLELLTLFEAVIELIILFKTLLVLFKLFKAVDWIL